MYIDDVHDYSQKPSPAVDGFLDTGRKEAIKKFVSQLIDAEYDVLAEYANDHISRIAAQRAERFLERVLQGEQDAAMALLGDATDGSRYRTYCGGKRERPWASWINGKVFESGGVELRRKIVEANVDIVRNERIADLESIVEGLKQQVEQLQKQLEFNDKFLPRQ